MVKAAAPTMAHSSLGIAERGSGGRFAILRRLLLGVALRSASNEQRARQGSAEGVDDSLLVFEGDHTIQGAHLLYGEQPPGDEPALSQICQQRGGLLNPSDEDPLACRRRREWERPVLLHGAVHRRDWFAVGIVVGVPQQRREPLGEPVRYGVLQLLGLLVHVLPRVAQL